MQGNIKRVILKYSTLTFAISRMLFGSKVKPVQFNFKLLIFTNGLSINYIRM